MTDFTYSSEDLSAARVALRDFELFERRAFYCGIIGTLAYMGGKMYKSTTGVALKSLNPRLALASLFVGSMT